MAVALRGYTALSYTSAESHDVAIPVAAVAGDLALLWCFDPDARNGGGPADRAGWAYHSVDMWSKVLTSADITAGAFAVVGRGSSLAVYSGAGGTVRAARSKTLTTTAVGSGLFWFAYLSPYNSGDPAGATYRLGSVVVALDGYKHSAHSRMVTTAGSYALDSVNRNSVVYGAVIDPIAAPLAPTVTSPASGAAVDVAAATAIAFVHNSSASLPMDQAKVRIRALGAGTWSWVQADGSISTEVAITTGTESVSIAAAALTVDTTYEFGVSTHDEGGWSEYSTSQQVTARALPTVVATLTTAAEDLSPTVSWVTTAGTGSQTAWEARIVPADATSWDDHVVKSGVISGADDEWTPAARTDYVNGGDYKAWVKVWDSALPSVPTASVAATVSWTPPAAPSGVTWADGAPGTVTVTGVSVDADTVEVQWTNNGAWETIATINPAGAPVVSLQVPRAGYGVDREYRARITEIVDGVSLPSAWTTIAAPVASTDGSACLVAVDDMTDYLAVDIATDAGRTPLEAVSTTVGLGATSARVDYTTRAGWQGETTLLAETQAAVTALEAWLDEHKGAFYFIMPPEKEGMNYVRVPELLVRRAGAVGRDRIAQVAIAHRTLTLGWVTA